MVSSGLSPRQLVGQAGEHAALTYLQNQDFKILARDWRCKLGQIDVVAMDGSVLVAVEVKTRRNQNFGLPQESVNGRKQHKLRLLLSSFQMANRCPELPCRIDVLAVFMNRDFEVTKVEHIKNAV